jgi:hypothetical protein
MLTWTKLVELPAVSDVHMVCLRLVGTFQVPREDPCVTALESENTSHHGVDLTLYIALLHPSLPQCFSLTITLFLILPFFPPTCAGGSRSFHYLQGREG